MRRNIDRFPEDFMFQLTLEEHEILRCQFGTLRFEHGKHRKYLPLVFTEQGVAMLSGVLNSERAVRVNVAIMRTFVRIRQILLEEALSHRVTELKMTTPILPDKRRKIGAK